MFRLVLKDVDVPFVSHDGTRVCPDAVRDMNFNIVWNPYGQKRRTIGQISVAIIRPCWSTGNLRRDMNTFNSDLSWVYKALFTVRGNFRMKPMNILREDLYGRDFLVFCYVGVDRKWRGKQIGLKAMRYIIDEFGASCMFAALLVSPMEGTKEESVAMILRLTRHYASMGFQSVGNNAMVLPLNTPRDCDED